MKEMIKNASILLAITIIAGAILGLVYQTTKDTISAREEADKKAAYLEVFADASDFVPVENYMTDANRLKLDEAGYGAETIDELLTAVDASGNPMGAVFTVTTSEGYGGDITFTVGISNDGTVNGVSILTINETAGLGMNADTEDFKSQFKGMNVSAIAYTKTGKQADYEIDAISGATITTNAFVNGVNAGLTYFRNVLMEGGNE